MASSLAQFIPMPAQDKAERISRKWKIEKLTEMFPGNEKLFHHYFELPERELAIVAGASIDAGLAEYLAAYLGGDPKAVEKFLGLDGFQRTNCDLSTPFAPYATRWRIESIFVSPISCSKANLIFSRLKFGRDFSC
jgi:hypothetical protein